MVDVLSVVLLIGLGMLIGYKLRHVDPTPSTEPVRAGYVQADGSAVLPRVPVAKPGPAPHQLPKGAHEERRIQVVVQPRQIEPAAVDDHLAAACSCEPVHVDLSLIRGKDGTGVVASSPDGQVLLDQSIDIPIASYAAPVRRNFALTTWQPGSGNYSAVVGRSFLGDRLVLGVGGNKLEGQPAGAVVGVGVKW